MNRSYFLLLLCVIGIFSGVIVSSNPAILEKLNYERQKVFLFPEEIKNLKHTLRSEKQFKEILVKQSRSDEPYIVISLTDNVLYLKQHDKMLRSCLVATGKQEKISYGNHAYRFFTPRQIFTIWKKEEHPLWIMPDWAYHELGKEPPPMNERQGIPNVLGDYALYLQDGYMIHGTIQNADLGKYLTHGCVRMGKQDLKALYAFVPIGTKVYIY